MAKIDDLNVMFEMLPMKDQLEITEAARRKACMALLRLEEVILSCDDEMLADAYAQIVTERERRALFMADTPPWEDR